MRKTLILAAALGLGIAAAAVFPARETTPRQPPAEIAAPAGEQQTALPPPPQTLPPEPAEEAEIQARPEKAELTGPAKPAKTAAGPDLSQYSCSIKREAADRPITPGVTLTPGESINIRLDNENERLRLKRGSATSSGGYQIIWERKY